MGALSVRGHRVKVWHLRPSPRFPHTASSLKGAGHEASVLHQKGPGSKGLTSDFVDGQGLASCNHSPLA